MARQWAIRDIRGQYRQSILGVLWVFITPLITAFIWVFLQDTGTIRLSDTGIPYPVYAFSGTLIWSVIVESINTPSHSTNSAKGVMSKINFPKEALLLSGFYKLLFNSIPKILLLVIFIFAFGVGYHHSLLLFPFALLGGVFFGYTLGLLITPISLLYKDVAKLVSTGLRFWMYITPVVFSIPDSGVMKTVMEYNPFTPFILTSRDLAVGTTPEYGTYFLLVMIGCIPLMAIGLIFYRISIPILIERMSA